MDRHELLALDKEALVELIIRLCERVTERESKLGRPGRRSAIPATPPTPAQSSLAPAGGDILREQ